MNVDNEERLITIAKEIVDMNDTVLGVIGKIVSFNESDFQMFQNWFEQSTGKKLVDICKDVKNIRKCAIEYLKSKNIDVPEDPTYETEQFNPRTSEEFLRTWNNDNVDDFGRGSR